MKPAVLVIDVQRILFDPLPQPFESEEVITRINRTTSWAREAGYPIVFIQHEQANSPIEFGCEGWQLPASLRTQEGDYFVRKTTPDAFLRTNLETLLNTLAVDRLIVCGYATEFCVDTTVRRAAGLRYPVTIVGDAHTTHDKDHATGEQIRTHHNATLPNITSFSVKIDVVSVASLIQ